MPKVSIPYATHMAALMLCIWGVMCAYSAAPILTGAYSGVIAKLSELLSDGHTVEMAALILRDYQFRFVWHYIFIIVGLSAAAVALISNGVTKVVVLLLSPLAYVLDTIFVRSLGVSLIDLYRARIMMLTGYSDFFSLLFLDIIFFVVSVFMCILVLRIAFRMRKPSSS